jgi:hypothetical protein
LVVAVVAVVVLLELPTILEVLVVEADQARSLIQL